MAAGGAGAGRPRAISPCWKWITAICGPRSSVQWKCCDGIRNSGRRRRRGHLDDRTPANRPGLRVAYERVKNRRASGALAMLSLLATACMSLTKDYEITPHTSQRFPPAETVQIIREEPAQPYATLAGFTGHETGDCPTQEPFCRLRELGKAMGTRLGSKAYKNRTSGRLDSDKQPDDQDSSLHDRNLARGFHPLPPDRATALNASRDRRKTSQASYREAKTEDRNSAPAGAGNTLR